ncbi:MAG: STAS/SEC14 domain-containing protein [Erythrobacter sp.]|nr:STAS/SEC14 domain-containing protein [Erythrobacter sp.]
MFAAMSNLAPVQSIKVDTDRAEVHFAIGGYWTREAMDKFLFDLGTAAKPFWKEGRAFNSLGDLSEFVAQSRETADAIRESLLLAQKNGMKRFAVVAPPAMVKLQYRRLTEGLDAEFFENETEALAWLR